MEIRKGFMKHIMSTFSGFRISQMSEDKDDYLIDFSGYLPYTNCQNLHSYNFPKIKNLLAVSYSGKIITKWDIIRNDRHVTLYHYHKFPMYFTSYDQIFFILHSIMPVGNSFNSSQTLFDDNGYPSRFGPTHLYKIITRY